MALMSRIEQWCRMDCHPEAFKFAQAEGSSEGSLGGTHKRRNATVAI